MHTDRKGAILYTIKETKKEENEKKKISKANSTAETISKKNLLGFF